MLYIKIRRKDDLKYYGYATYDFCYPFLYSGIYLFLMICRTYDHSRRPWRVYRRPLWVRIAINRLTQLFSAKAKGGIEPVYYAEHSYNGGTS